MAKKFSGEEKRRALRRPILETFSVFVVVPKKGDIRLPIHDISELGIGFDLDTGGESPEDFPIKEGEQVEVQVYLNQSLYIPLSVKVRRISEEDSIRNIGAEFKEKSKGSAALESFVKFIDDVVDVGHVKK